MFHQKRVGLRHTKGILFLFLSTNYPAGLPNSPKYLDFSNATSCEVNRQQSRVKLDFLRQGTRTAGQVTSLLTFYTDYIRRPC